VDGVLVPPADPGALAVAVVRLLRDPVLRTRLSEAGYRTVAERFSIDAQVRRIESVYDEELARAGVPGVRVGVVEARRPVGRATLEVPPV
jgi:glycosyltransferase involved in cell wall biosynthesis